MALEKVSCSVCFSPIEWKKFRPNGLAKERRPKTRRGAISNLSIRWKLSQREWRVAFMGTIDRDEIRRLKLEADLVSYACARRGYSISETESSPRGNPTHWVLRRSSDDRKLVALRGRADGCWLYYDLGKHGAQLGAGGRPTGHDGYGSIIDFIQEELALPKGRGTQGLVLAVRELRDFVGAMPVRATPRAPAPAGGSSREPSPCVLERWNAAREVQNSRYLSSRALVSQAWNHQRFRGTWREESRGNVLFAHRDLSGKLTGFDIKNRGMSLFSPGGVKTATWRSNDLPNDRYLLLTESAINSLSFHQLHPELAVRHRSFGGRIGTAQLELVRREVERLPRRMTVLLAFDGQDDPAGQRYEEQVRRILPSGLRVEVAHPPRCKDWNDYLQEVALER